MNVLDVIAAVLGGTVYKGYLPPEPDTCLSLFEYGGETLVNYFGGGQMIPHGIQARARSPDAQTAYNMAEAAAQTLNGYCADDLSVSQTTPVLDIGRDDKQRQEYTVNFTGRR
ncbi:MAG: minor capsid protein [Oscillospiraceae bacterium]|jgi:hypothetical protein|nr:minor capsid protein [Oscillospiraceae bacterium]